jgi:hypothetical protein
MGANLRFDIQAGSMFGIRQSGPPLVPGWPVFSARRPRQWALIGDGDPEQGAPRDVGGGDRQAGSAWMSRRCERTTSRCGIDDGGLGKRYPRRAGSREPPREPNFRELSSARRPRGPGSTRSPSRAVWFVLHRY